MSSVEGLRDEDEGELTSRGERIRRQDATGWHFQETIMVIRWMIRIDLEQVLDIEGQCFEFAWSEGDFLYHLKQRNRIGMVAEHQERIVGYMVYELLKGKICILNFAVAPWAQRQGIGCHMIENLLHKLSPTRRTEILLEVRETNLAAQLFFRSQRFRAFGVLRDHYEDTSEDAYQMRYNLRDVERPFAVTNRIAEFST